TLVPLMLIGVAGVLGKVVAVEPPTLLERSWLTRVERSRLTRFPKFAGARPPAAGLIPPLVATVPVATDPLVPPRSAEPFIAASTGRSCCISFCKFTSRALKSED